MYNTVFEYYLSDSDSVMIKATCDDVSNWATNLKLEFPKGFRPTREVADDIETKAVNELLKEKNSKNRKVELN